MIRVDPRRGSGEFVRLLRRLGIDCKPATLKFGDFAFRGYGPNGRVRIGIERKTVTEILGTLSSDSRLVGWQLPGMLGKRPDGTRRYDWTYVVVEGKGSVRPEHRTGALLDGKFLAGHGAQTHLYENFEKFLTTIDRKAATRIKMTSGKVHTAYWIAALYRWAQKEWHQHKGAYRIDETQPDAAILTPRTVRLKVLAQIPQLGWVRARYAADYFGSIAAAINAEPSEWTHVTWTSPKGRAMRIGPKTARVIWGLLHAKDDETKGKGR